MTMEIILGINKVISPFNKPVVTLGNFDGVHLGHQKILKRIIDEAGRIHGESVVITFEPHPLKLLHPEQCPPLLTPFGKKMTLMERTGVQKVLCIQFTKAFSEMSPHEFVKQVLKQKLGAKKVVVGYNYRFGKGKFGDSESLKTICLLFDIAVEVVDALTVGDTLVSSSRVRDLVRRGEIESTSTLLGRNYSVTGQVIEGSKRGHALGFPTANLEISEDVLYPKPGVYAVEVEWNKVVLNGLANVGFNPTFNQRAFSLEVYLLDFNHQIYGHELEISFIKRIRDEIRFQSPSELIDQIKKDVLWAREHIFQERADPPIESTCQT